MEQNEKMKHIYDNILFDLDGTIIESGPGITRSVAYALHKFGIQVENLESLYDFVGPPLDQSFMRRYQFSREQANQAVAYYREYYGVKGIFECRVYDGVEQMLSSLKAAGRRVYLATSKPQVYAEKIIEHLGFTRYFDGVFGPDIRLETSTKAQVIARAMQDHGMEKTHTIMVGDRFYDVRGAETCGIETIGVTYGYGTAEELLEAGAVAVAETAEELLQLLLSAGEGNLK